MNTQTYNWDELFGDKHVTIHNRPYNFAVGFEAITNRWGKPLVLYGVDFVSRTSRKYRWIESISSEAQHSLHDYIKNRLIADWKVERDKAELKIPR